MRVPASPLLAVVCLIVGGCGSDAAEKAPAAARTPAATPSAEQQVAAVARRYLQAIAKEDWRAVCATRVRSEQEDMADVAGSCPKAMAAIFSAKAFKIFAS